jgi:hypothetical protein
MRRTWRFLVPTLLVIVLAVAWLEPTHCIRGWLRGEALYQGRPTSFWSSALRDWQPTRENHLGITRAPDGNHVPFVIWQWELRPGRFNRYLPDGWRSVGLVSHRPVVAVTNDRHPASRPVLQELLADPAPNVQMAARQALIELEMVESD